MGSLFSMVSDYQFAKELADDIFALKDFQYR